MDIGFEIVIPIDSKVSAIEFKQPVYEWDGVAYPQGPEEAYFHYYKLTKTNIPQYVVSFIPDHLQKIQWQCISVKKGLDELYQELKDVENETQENRNKLLELLNIFISNEPRWFVNFELNFDQIDEVKEGDISTVYQGILDSLSVERKGFLIWHDESH